MSAQNGDVFESGVLSRINGCPQKTVEVMWTRDDLRRAALAGWEYGGAILETVRVAALAYQDNDK